MLRHADGATRQEFLDKLRKHRSEMACLLEIAEKNGMHYVERFYSQSFHVYQLQSLTMRIVKLLQQLAPEGFMLNPWFVEIVIDGCNKEFKVEHNDQWVLHTRPIVDAFFHTRHFLTAAVESSRDQEPPSRFPCPSSWMTIFELFWPDEQRFHDALKRLSEIEPKSHSVSLRQIEWLMAFDDLKIAGN
ncbi:MAG: hypothetical protein HQM09_17575 [Candidatus Riflebacteria bacterium]|nr:hypothetical protein [Candidatus Riflebacteria bacterium]